MAIRFGYKAPQAPRAPRVQTSFQTQRQTSGFNEPFPSLSGQAAPRVQPFQGGQTQKSTSGFGQQPARPPTQQPTVNPQATAQNQAAPQTPQVGYSYDADPVLNQIQALSGQSRGDAGANANALRLQLAQQYGDVGLARQYGGEAQAQAAGANPNSVLAQLAHSYQTGQQGLEEALNQQNLFYSGARVKQLGELANQYQAQQAGAAGQEQDALGSIAANLAAAQHAADLQDLQAQQDAYNRQLQAALLAGGTGAGGTGLPTDMPADAGLDSGAGPADTLSEMFAPPADSYNFSNPAQIAQIAQVANAYTPQTLPATPWDQILAQLQQPSSGSRILGKSLRG